MVTHAHPRSEISHSLGLAVIESSAAPLMLLDERLDVVALSTSFCQVFEVDPVGVPGRTLATLGAGEWNVPQLMVLLKATAGGTAEVGSYDMDLRRPGKPTRRLVLGARKLEYGDPENVRLLLSVADVTEARIAERLKDDLLREKAVLLQELQHRVANSLQIIASVLLQSARRVQSDETRTHLHAAHQRIMSVAALQKQLAASTKDDVGLRAYFTELCASLGASMIRDHDKISLTVMSDNSTASADVSVSLGLIVTELVINALKHAFPGDRAGKIVVDFEAIGLAGWHLSVGDDGVGMPDAASVAKPGLGTSIVQALARQLSARIEVADARPGTEVSIIREDGKPDPVAVETAV